MNSYNISSGTIDLGVAAGGTCIFALNNPAGSGKSLFLKNLTVRWDFVGTPGATRVTASINRATGTAAGGSGSKSTTGIPKRNTRNVDSIASAFWGPTAITGLTDATPEGTMKSVSIPSQIQAGSEDLIEDVKNFNETDPLTIEPGTSLVLRLSSAAVAGSALSVDVAWSEA